MVTEFNNSVNGFRIDGVDRIHRLTWSNFVQIDELISSYGEYIVGSVRVGDTDALVIDMERILGEIFPEQVLEEVTEETIKTGEKTSRESILIFLQKNQKQSGKQLPVL